MSKLMKYKNPIILLLFVIIITIVMLSLVLKATEPRQGGSALILNDSNAVFWNVLVVLRVSGENDSGGDVENHDHELFRYDYFAEDDKGYENKIFERGEDLRLDNE